MNWLILVNKKTGQIDGWVSNSYRMPILADLGDFDDKKMVTYELWDKATYDRVINEMGRLEADIDSISNQLLDPDLGIKDATNLREHRDRMQTELENKRSALRPLIDGEVTRDHKLVVVQGGFTTAASLNPVQPPQPPPPVDVIAEIDQIKARIQALGG